VLFAATIFTAFGRKLKLHIWLEYAKIAEVFDNIKKARVVETEHMKIPDILPLLFYNTKRPCDPLDYPITELKSGHVASILCSASHRCLCSTKVLTDFGKNPKVYILGNLVEMSKVFANINTLEVACAQFNAEVPVFRASFSRP
jgi:hypothetical protein